MKKFRIILLAGLLGLTTISYGLDNYRREETPFLEGYFIRSQDNLVFIQDFQGHTRQVDMKPNGEKLVDGRPVGLGEFITGMEVFIEQDENQIGQGIYAYSTAHPGYRSQGQQVVGRISRIDRNILRLEDLAGREEDYYLMPHSQISRNARPAQASQLYQGDRVKIHLAGPDSREIKRLEIEGQSQAIKDICKGQLDQVDPLTGQLVFSQLEVFTNGGWEKGPASLKLAWDGEGIISYKGQELDLASLRNLRGSLAYLALEDDFSSPRARRINLADREEKRYSSKIGDINLYTQQLELANKENIGLSQHTLVVKNGRLVDIGDLKPGSDGLVITSGLGDQPLADLIYIYNESLNNSNIGRDQFYTARLDRIHRDRVDLGDFFILNQEEWESFSQEKSLSYDQSTYIYDLDKGEEVTSQEFFTRGYSVDEDSRRGKRDHYGYIYTNGDRIASIYIKKRQDPLLVQRISTGILEAGPVEDPHMGPRISLKNTRDWSRRDQAWINKNAPLYIYLEESMIIKNGQRIKLEALEAGDRLYLVRDSNMAKLIIVK